MSTKRRAQKSESEFDKRYEVLNKAQRQAVDAIDGPVMVIAGPGTGKTTILTLRIANILRQTDTPPDAILALTFTESAAFAMRRKLLEIIGPAAYKVRIHTFHGFAESIIQEYPDYFPRIIGSAVITEAEQIRIVDGIIKNAEVEILRPYGDPSYYVKSVLNEIHLLKRENVSPGRLMESIGTDWHSAGAKTDTSPRAADLSKTDLEKLTKRDDKNRELALVYRKYEDALAAQKYYDFDDMLLELIRAMEDNPTFKLMLQESFHYILADEHQDANASQNRILELLADFHDSPNLFIVGDDKQAIYRFQGASLENFLYFTRKYPAAVVIDLEHNYRSHQGILDASHSLIVNNPGIPGRERRRLVSLQVGNKPIFVDEFSTGDDELQYLAALIEGLIKKGEKPEEIAILYRENKDALGVSQALKILGVAHRIESNGNVMDEPDIVKIIMICRALNDPGNNEFLGQALLLKELKCDPAEVSEIFRESSRTGRPVHALIGRGGSPALKSAYGRLVGWTRLAQVLPFSDFLQKLVQETEMVAGIVAEEDSLEKLSALEAFFDEVVTAARAKRSFYLKDFIAYMDVVRDHGIVSRPGYVDHIKGVRLMTAHRAKGLEFNHVFIVHAIDGVWGNRKKRHFFSIPVIEHARDEGRIEDERRLFYVAMTRARESVNISYARQSDGKELVASQFIAEIDPKLVAFGAPKAVPPLRQFIQRATTLPAAHSLLDREFVKSKFFSQPFSVTHLNNYLACPWQYFFVNLVRLPQTPTKHQMYGTAVHAALRSLFDAYRDGRDLSQKQLVDIFKYHLERQPLSKIDRRESYEKGRTALSGYYRKYAGTWPRALKTEVSMKAAVPVNGERLALTGKLDKITFIADSVVIVTDFKTAKPKSRNEIEGKTKGADGNYKRQLVFYKLLLDLSGLYAMKSGEIDFVEPTESGSYQKISFEITSAETAQLLKQIEHVAGDIASGAFAENGCGQKGCAYCALGNILKKQAV
ncbi:MAG: ATP-dependent helicase [Patescibacteria group bacterium]|nr:ATP-dependent helicase [Patescibacteria group bacterium]MDE2172509.1 ATP-dependent helicase [Patescibacteria group bacterium]